MRHVADAVNEDEQANETHHYQHRCRQRVKHPTKLQRRLAEYEPIEVVHLPRRLALRAQRRHKRQACQDKRQQHRPDGE
jgi:hypothetical protein